MPPFPMPTHVPSWFVGHMATSLRMLPRTLSNIDLVIEVRDARLPISSVNPAFEKALRQAWGGAGWDRNGKGREVDWTPSVAPESPEGPELELEGSEPGPSGSGGSRDGRRVAKSITKQKVPRGRERMVVYTKRDLAESRYEEPLRKAFLEHGHTTVLFANTQSDADASKILRHAVRLAKERGHTLAEDFRIMVVGMPNVGKSSLLNALRRVGMHKGKAFPTSSFPGLTRKLTGTVKIHGDPLVYVYDTPGVMMPYLGNSVVGAERGLKLALTEYLLWFLNERMKLERDWAECDPARHLPYTALLPLPTSYPTMAPSLSSLLEALAKRLGLLLRGGEPDLAATRNWFLNAFREGKIGRWTLDDLEGDILGERADDALGDHDHEYKWDGEGGTGSMYSGEAQDGALDEMIGGERDDDRIIGDNGSAQRIPRSSAQTTDGDGGESIHETQRRAKTEPTTTIGGNITPDAEEDFIDPRDPRAGFVTGIKRPSSRLRSTARESADIQNSRSLSEDSQRETNVASTSTSTSSDGETTEYSSTVTALQSSELHTTHEGLEATSGSSGNDDDPDKITTSDPTIDPETDMDADAGTQSQTQLTPLELRVSTTVQFFLAAQDSRLRSSEQGKTADLSQTQIRKRENEQKAREREEKWKAKGVGAGQSGDWRKGGYVRGGGARAGVWKSPGAKKSPGWGKKGGAAGGGGPGGAKKGK